MNKEEQDYMNQLKAAFEEQRGVELRRLSITPERYIKLAYTYQKITDEEELKDFAYISTHPDVKAYYMSSNTGLVIAEKLDSIGRTKVDVTVQSHSRIKIDNPIKIELTSKGWWQLLSPRLPMCAIRAIWPPHDRSRWRVSLSCALLGMAILLC